MRWLLLVAVAACQPAGVGMLITCLVLLLCVYLLNDLVGGWRWLLRTPDVGTTRVEAETWWLWFMSGVPTQLTGRYLREVEVRSDDRVPFVCNQRPWYCQRAIYDVTVQTVFSGFIVRETDYRTEPGPCDHGFRYFVSYVGDVDGERFTLHWDSGD